ncbi:MAG: 1-acyl-sn-glycerol-3-phosphate acyltransferase [Deltaproteobacteria bacterium]|nr:1-acyl-sn-glycerol-3-phosphate acyltransferase [Deltaproteobacteria bacterium]
MINGIKKIATVVYSAYVLLLFIAFIPLALVYYLLIFFFPTNTRLRLVYRFHRLWIFTVALLSFIRIKVRGAEKIIRDETYVFVVNHCNLFDTAIAGSCIQHPFKPLAKRELFKIPGLGWLFAMASVPVNRSSKESRKKSFDEMVKAIKGKTSILLFPEGTRNRTDKPLKSFYDGSFRLAIDCQVPVMPIVLLDVRALQPVDSLKMYPGKVSMNFLEPIPTQGMDSSHVEKLKQKVYAVMEKFILENDKMFRPKSPQASK